MDDDQAFRDKAYGWGAVLVPKGSPIHVSACEAAGCSGPVLASLTTGEVWLLDGSDLVMWSGYLCVRESGDDG